MEESRVPKGLREDPMLMEVLMDCPSKDSKFCELKLRDEGTVLVPLYEGSKRGRTVSTS